MPTIAVDGCPLNVEVEGRENAPVLMLSNSLGTDLHMWDDQAAEFARHFRLIRYDRRGHGKSGASKGPYSFERFGRDILAIADAAQGQDLQLVRAVDGRHGRAMARRQRAGPRREARARQHQLSITPTRARGHDRIKFVREKGLEPLVDANMERWFTKGFRERAPQAIARMKEIFLGSNRDGYIACVEAIRDMDFRASNPRITAPTLVIVGKQDPATPPAAGEAIAAQIKGAKVAALDAAHISNIEQPKAFTEAVLNFLG